MDKQNLKVLFDILKKKPYEINNIEFNKGNLSIIAALKIIDYSLMLGNSTKILNPDDHRYWLRIFETHSHGFYDFAKKNYKNNNCPMLLPKIIPSTLIEKIMQQLGDYAEISFLKRFVDVAYHENAKCDVSGNNYTIKFPPYTSTIEIIETRSQAWLKDHLIQENKAELEVEIANYLLPTVRLLENDLFYDETILNLYSTISKSFSSACLGFDYYNENAKFGNITFENYRLVVNELVAYAELQRDLFIYNLKVKKISIDDLQYLSPVILKKNIIAFLETRLELDGYSLEEVLNTIILDQKKIDNNIFPAGYAAPILTEIDPYRVVLSLTSLLTNPFMYLHRCLRTCFPIDYVTAASNREDRFKFDIYSCFDAPVLKVKTNLRIRDNNNNDKTDVDAILYHEEEQIIIFIQLKWMEDWATDMRLRRNMKTEFEIKINKWLNIVDNYLANENIEQLNQRLKLKNITKHTKVYKLILGKHFTHFDGLKRITKNHYLNWARLFRLLEDNPKCKKSLRYFIEQVSKINIYNEAETLYNSIPNLTFMIDTLKVDIVMNKEIELK